MESSDRRDAARTPCQVPVRLTWEGRTVEAMALDISLRGARLLIPAASLVEDPHASMAVLARQICEALPPRVPTCFHPELLGPLVQRVLHVVRVGVQAGTESAVELGCRLDRPLQEVDAAAMGVAVAKMGETATEARRRQPLMGPRVRRRPGDDLPSAPHRVPSFDQPPSFPRRSVVQLRAEGEDQDRTIVGYTESVDKTGVVVLVPRRDRLDLAQDEDSVSALFAQFCDTYGALFHMCVRDASRTVWTGAVRIRSLEVMPANPDAVLLGFAFVTPRAANVKTTTTATA